MKRIISFVLCLVMLFGFVVAAPAAEHTQVHAATASQNNIVARANYLYNSTWVCQKTVSGWRGNYTFTKGNTYRLPYGQPVYAGAYIGFSVSVDDFLAAAANANSVFYTSQSNYAGKYSTYYATDCSAFVSWSWGTARQTTATIPNMSTYIGNVTTSNVTNKLQLGDCLNSTSAGHVVLVTGLSYNASGAVTNIEITEQTPPQLKRTNHTVSSLVSKYGASYKIYRYTGTVPAAPGGSSSSTTSFGVKVSENLKNWIFNANYYRNKYSDLASMTDSQLYAHFLDYGISEGRQGSALFNIKYYLEKNTDLKETFGTSYEEAFKHFVDYGQREDRVYSKEVTAVKDVIFDAEFYWEKYPDVAESMKGDVNRSFCHFLKIGLGKGYAASPAFSIQYYINENDGLKSLYSKDYYGAMQHFVEYGKKEQRGVSPMLDTAYYIEKYPEAGTTTLSAMKHFLSTGMEQGLDSNPNFHAEFYYFSHPERLANYTQENCYMHYLLSGYEDGLRAAPHAFYPENYANLGAGFTARLTNLKSELNWSISGTSVIIYTPSDSDAQKWHFARHSDGSYTITNVKYGTVLTASDNGSADGLISIQEDTGGAHQRWYLYEVGGYYSFRTACNKWVGIGLTGGTTTSGTTVEMANFRDNDGHKYTLTVLSTDTVACEEHSYMSSVLVAPSCTQSGVSRYTCTVCGDSYSGSVDALGHSYATAVTPMTCTEDGFTTYACEHCGESFTTDYQLAPGHDWLPATCTQAPACAACGQTDGDEPGGHSYAPVITAPTCTEEGYTAYTCSDCGHSYGVPGEPATGHNVVNGICTGCGLVYQVPEISLKYPTASLESQIYMTIYFATEGLTDVPVEDMGLLTWSTEQTDGTFDTAEKVIPGAEESGEYLAVRTADIPAKELGDTIYFKIYARLTDGSYVYSAMRSTSPREYAMSRINKSSDLNQVALCVSMLNYGAQAQRYFGYKTDALMNAELTEAQQALVAAYSPYMVDAVDQPDAAKVGSFTNTGGFSRKYPSVSLESAFGINYYFTPDHTPDSAPKLYYWDEATYNSVSVLLPSNATGCITLEGSGTVTGGVEDIPAKNLSDTVYVAAGYMSAGKSYCTGVLAYSIGAFCTDRADSAGAKDQPLAAAIAVYGYYAKLYFSGITG